LQYPKTKKIIESARDGCYSPTHIFVSIKPIGRTSIALFTFFGIILQPVKVAGFVFAYNKLLVSM